MNNDYYVYIYYRLDINEPFYVGKGHNDRWRWLYHRNEHFMNIINKHPVVVVIEKDNLTEIEAFYWEEEIIKQLVFEYGFSIDIPGNRDRNHYCHLVNCTWGGEGVSGLNSTERRTYEEVENWKKNISKSLKGKNPLKNKNEAELLEIRQKMSNAKIGVYNGEKHPMYGKHHSEETKKKISKNRRGKCKGKDNHLYGISRTGKDGIASKPVICLTTKRIFWSAQEGANYYGIKSSGNITTCCKGYKIENGKRHNCKYAGKLKDGRKLVWRYLTWKHNKKYRIKINKQQIK